MDLRQFEQIYEELDRHEKKQFAQYINDQVVDLHEISYPYDEAFPLSKSELLELLKSREDALDAIVSENIGEAKIWLQRAIMG